MVFNLFDPLIVIPNLCDHFHLIESEVFSYFVHFDFVNSSALDFVKDFHIDLLSSVENTKLLCRHITTCNDDLKSITENGLLTLDQVLAQNTPLKHFLADFGIVIDVVHQVIMIHDKCCLINGWDDPCIPCVKNCSYKQQQKARYDCCDYHEKMALLHNKLYHDRCEVEAYISGSDKEMLRTYQSVAEAPEILLTIGDLVQTIYAKWNPCFLHDFWKSRDGMKHYILEFAVPLCFIETNTCFENVVDYYNFSGRYDYTGFELNDYCEGRIPKEFFLNKKLLEECLHALRYIFAPYDLVENGYCQILPNYHINPETITVHYESNLYTE